MEQEFREKCQGDCLRTCQSTAGETNVARKALVLDHDSSLDKRPILYIQMLRWRSCVTKWLTAELTCSVSLLRSWASMRVQGTLKVTGSVRDTKWFPWVAEASRKRIVLRFALFSRLGLFSVKFFRSSYRKIDTLTEQQYFIASRRYLLFWVFFSNPGAKLTFEVHKISVYGSSWGGTDLTLLGTP